MVESQPSKLLVAGPIPVSRSKFNRSDGTATARGKSNCQTAMANRTQPGTIKEWIRYIAAAVIALWLVVWMLRISGINIP